MPVRALSERFSHVIDSQEALREIVSEPSQLALDKEIDHIDSYCRGFIEKSPFLVLATRSALGHLDLSPKGDPAGFVQVLDENTLILPDRLGNQRQDSFSNVIDNPHVGLFFMVPGKTETLRVRGQALLVRDEDVRKPLAVNGKVPDFALAIHVERAFFHCAKCMMRSHLWEPEKWDDISEMPSFGEALVAHCKLDMKGDDLQVLLDEGSRETLY